MERNMKLSSEDIESISKLETQITTNKAATEQYCSLHYRQMEKLVENIKKNEDKVAKNTHQLISIDEEIDEHRKKLAVLKSEKQYLEKDSERLRKETQALKLSKIAQETKFEYKHRKMQKEFMFMSSINSRYGGQKSPNVQGKRVTSSYF